MRPLDIFYAMLVPFLWGMNFVAAKYGTAFFPPFLLTALRFMMVSVLLIPFVDRPTKKQLGSILPLSVMSTLHFSLIFVAIYYQLDIASSALIGQLGVPIACVLGAMFLGDKIGLWRISGIIIAFIGTAIVSGAPNILEHMNGFYAALGSTLTWGVANVLIKRVEGMSPMSMLAWSGLCNVPMLFALSYVFEYSVWPNLLDAPFTAIAGVTYTALCSTVLAYGLWYTLLKKYSVSQVTPYSLTTPVFGIAFGQIFFHEQLTMPVIVGGIVTIIGVAVIVVRRPKTIMLGEAT